MIKVKVFLNLAIDKEEYAVPVDGQVGEEIEEAIEEYFYDIDGVTIKSIKTIME